MITRIEASESKPAIPDSPEKIGFGKLFTERMFIQKYKRGYGWHDPVIIPREKFPQLNPASLVLHYGQEIFEGLKAYRRPDGNINLFRPWENAMRFNKSAQRMMMPTVPIEEHLEAIRTLVREEHAWAPAFPDTSLYIRPTMIATSAELGLKPSDEYLHFILLFLASNYFSNSEPSAVKIETHDRRSVVGGTGTAKTGGNYAGSLSAAEKAKSEGYAQVLWLDGREGRYVEEVGAMNICFVYNGDTIITPALSGSILPGITRDSVIRLAPDLGYRVEEARMDINQVLSDIENGLITESFGCGTAAVITPVGRFGYSGRDYLINGGKAGSVATKLKQKLTAIQYGTEPDPYGWTETIKVI